MRAVRGLRQTGSEPVIAFDLERFSADQAAFAPTSAGGKRIVAATGK